MAGKFSNTPQVMLPWRWRMISRHWSIAARSVLYKSLFLPKESYWLFFSQLHFSTFLSPGYKSSHAIGRRNEGCIWYCYKSLINQAGLGVSHCLQCHVAAASICCGQPGQKLHTGGSAVEGTDRRLLGCKTVLWWQCCGSQIHYKA